MNQQISLRYRTKRHTFGLLLTLLLFPLWAVTGIFGGLIAFAWMNLFAMALFAGLLIAGVVATVSFQDFALTVSESGFGFPLFYLPQLKFRRERPWNEIGKFALEVRDSEPLTKGAVRVYFTNGQSVPIELSGLSRPDLEQLLLAIDIWGRHAEKDPALKTLQASLTDVHHDGKSLSYTKMWEDEMNRRFSSTAFVPLSAGHALQNGRLKVIRQHAFGGLSAIYLAQLNEVETVVLKEFVVPDADESLKAKAHELFERESHILKRLHHDQIARVRDHFVEEDRTYLVLDFIPGTDLRQIVSRKGPQPEIDVLNWSIQIAETLVYLHTQSPPVVHRDLTPDNIVLTENNRIVVIDFGAANEFIGTATGTLVGKQSYISPEQFRGETRPESDFYSLGATMHYLLTGQEPIPLMRSEPRLTNSQISPALDSVVQRATALDFDQRYSDASEMLEALKAAVDSLGGATKKSPAGAVDSASPDTEFDASTLAPEEVVHKVSAE